MTGWRSLRKAVYRRDAGHCQACGRMVGRVWDAGHLVDRIVGGEDSIENLVLMCVRCNRSQKPIHRTLDEARAWLKKAPEKREEIATDWRPAWELVKGA